MLVHSAFFLRNLFHFFRETLLGNVTLENVEEDHKKYHFKLLKLPRVAIVQILRKVDLIDLLDLSLCSRKMRLIIASIDWKSSHCDILVWVGFTGVVVVFEDGSRVYWRFTSDISIIKGMLRPGEEFSPRKVGGVVLQMSAKNWDRRLIYSVTADFETNVRIVLEHLLYVFRCSIRILSISSSATNIFFSHSPKLKIKHLYVKSDDNKLTENLEKILKSVEAEGCVQIEGDGCISGGAEEFFRLDYVYVPRAQWVTRRHLLRADCRKMILYNPDLTQVDLNVVFQRWLRGESRLEKLLIYSPGICRGSVDDILEGIPIRPWDPNRRHRWLRFNEWTAVDCRQGCDIERSDGTLATVVFDHHTVVFSVWEQLFPDFSIPFNHSWRLIFDTLIAENVERRPNFCDSEYEARAYFDFSSDQ